MKRQIKTILVPVDFTGNTELAISKALEFCPETNGKSTICLFHVQRILTGGIPSMLTHFVSGYTQQQFTADARNISNQLEILKASIQKDRKDINVLCNIGFGDPVQESIIRKARQLPADLVILGKNSHHSLLPFLNTVNPGKIAAKTGIPVLTAKAGSFNREIKMIVIPVNEYFPDAKLEMLASLGNGSRPQIRLVIFKEDRVSLSEARQRLLKAFRKLKTELLNSVNYEILDGKNKVKALLDYCNKIGADILIVYPETEKHAGNPLNSKMSDLLPSKSKTQILAISPG